MRAPMAGFLTLTVMGLHAGLIRADTIEERHRLWDFSPASAANPVLLRVKDCHVEIPVSEFRAYLNSYVPPGREGQLLAPQEKRQELQKLLDDHFWVWVGYRDKGDQSEEVLRLLRITQKDAMKMALVDQESGTEFANVEDYTAATQKVVQRLFDKTDVSVSLPGYDLLKAEARHIDAADRAKAAGQYPGPATSPASVTLGPAPETPAPPDPNDLVTPLATCKVGTIRVGDILQGYKQIPLGSRPDLEKRDVVLGILRDLWADALLDAEAKAQGLENSDFVRSRMEVDRDGLLEQWALKQTTIRADVMMKAPGIEERLHQWYASHLDAYTTKDDAGRDQVTPFAATRELVYGDCFNDLQERLRAQELAKIRSEHIIEIDEKMLDSLTFQWPAPLTPGQLRALQKAEK